MKIRSKPIRIPGSPRKIHVFPSFRHWHLKFHGDVVQYLAGQVHSQTRSIHVVLAVAVLGWQPGKRRASSVTDWDWTKKMVVSCKKMIWGKFQRIGVRDNLLEENALEHVHPLLAKTISGSPAYHTNLSLGWSGDIQQPCHGRQTFFIQRWYHRHVCLKIYPQFQRSIIIFRPSEIPSGKLT